jgi:Ca2+-transporting ATPase
MTTTKHPIEGVLWYALSAGDAAERIGVDPDQGLGVDEAGRRLAEYGPNELPTEPPPSVWTVARGQLSNQGLGKVRACLVGDGRVVRCP